MTRLLLLLLAVLLLATYVFLVVRPVWICIGPARLGGGEL
jgi:hypothetical protein